MAARPPSEANRRRPLRGSDPHVRFSRHPLLTHPQNSGCLVFASCSFEIPDDGCILLPSRTYLGVTLEYTETHQHVPFLEGKSSVGRLGIDIHATAGKGDVGFCNHWTLEISVAQPVRVYHGMPIAQLIYFEVRGEIAMRYDRKHPPNTTNGAPCPSNP